MTGAQTIGALLQDLQRGGDLLASLDGDLDLVLLGRLQTLAVKLGGTSREVLRAAIGDFLSQGGDEDWATLIGRLERAHAPGPACVAFILERYLAKQGG